MKPHNWRVFQQFRRLWRFLTPGLILHARWHETPRPTYCARCGGWTWCTAEIPALSTKSAFICHECADINDADCDEAWSSLCGGNY
jgi:hypothetical protein